MTLLLGTVAGLAIAELGLRYYAGYVQSRQEMDPGFLVFRPEFGWLMASNWTGRHHHYDFDVRYSTNGQGLRGSWPAPVPGVRRHALIGDSFTFGLGVNDDETFAQRLNQQSHETVYLNAGIAGYSTDQEFCISKNICGSGRWRS